MMNESDAEHFVTAAHKRLDAHREMAVIAVGDARWVVGFVQGAPYRLAPASEEKEAARASWVGQGAAPR